jgi:hypothetical protein
MNITAIGSLRPHPTIPEWLVSDPVSVPYFDGRRLAFTFDGLDAADEDEAKSTIAAFLALGTQDRAAAAPYVYTNYRYVASLVDKADLACEIASAQSVWEHVQPSEIFVSRRHRHDRAIYVQITAECAWEPEHGLQIVYRRGCQLARVSEQDGHLTHTDACDLPESEDKIVEAPAGGLKDQARKSWWRFW